ncbi:MAG: hypothetical protein WDZ83_19240 [Rhizobiaceae bacterium]
MNTSEHRILALYKRLMDEARRRIDAIEMLVNRETGLEARFAREAAYLQLRMICEIIAVGCVVAHDGLAELDASKELRKAFAADRIVNALSSLHDRFYPQPIRVERETAGHISVRDADVEHLSKDELKALYRSCGNALHRGTPAKIVAGEKLEADWISNVMHNSQLAANLLSSHALVMRGDERAIFANFISGEVWIGDAL